MNQLERLYVSIFFYLNSGLLFLGIKYSVLFFPCSFAFCLYLSDWPLTLTTGGESGTSPL